MSDNTHGIGAPVKRREDLRFLTGRGNYTDDICRPNQAFAYILRSPVAHAKIKSINADAAKNAPGVVGVWTGADMQCGSIPCGWLVKNKDGSDMNEPPHPPLAQNKVRHTGDQVAVVVADSLQQAKDAAHMIAVDYEPLDAVVDMEKAVSGGASVHDEAPGNICFDWELCLAEGGEAEIDKVLEESAHRVSMQIRNNRLAPCAMEPRAAIGEYDPSADSYTLYTTSQNPHLIRLLMGAFVLQIPEHKLRVVSPDVGGGFGSKIYHYAEEAIVTWAAKQARRPVKWTAERSESFLTDAHGRDHISDVVLGLDADGKFTALKVNTKANMGAYLSTFSTCVPTYLYATLLAGVYTTPKIYANVKAIFTNTAPVDAYRGAGRPEATFLLERIVEKAARQTGIDRVELRRKNFIAPDAFPYQTPVALQYDSGDYHASLDAALKESDWGGFAARKKESAAKGKLRGIGISTYIEACGIAPSAVVGSLGARAGLFEAANVRVNPTGSVTVFTGSHSHGQGHETTFAQLVSDKLGIPFDSVDIVHGDTAKIPFGMGTYGSRSLAVGGEAIVRALNKITAKAAKIAAHMMEADSSDVEFAGGDFSVKGTDKKLSFGEVALSAYVPHNFPHKTSHDDAEGLEPGLEEQAFYDPVNFTYPAGCHICEVEIDPETGKTTVEKFTAVDDVGRVVNPMIVEGQVQGGVAQGIGQALLEQAVYDEDGQLTTGSFMDYAMPRADNIPNIAVHQTTTLCAHNSLGVKGCGEVGAIGSPPAVINAVLDALLEKGVEDINMPATPFRVWDAIQ
ncbi:MAG: xanthine dehydrogenase family protein molybdopterin-binding subunit, partial [Gammaproteobacteria bacterium]